MLISPLISRNPWYLGGLHIVLSESTLLPLLDLRPSWGSCKVPLLYWVNGNLLDRYLDAQLKCFCHSRYRGRILRRHEYYVAADVWTPKQVSVHKREHWARDIILCITARRTPSRRRRAHNKGLVKCRGSGTRDKSPRQWRRHAITSKFAFNLG